VRLNAWLGRIRAMNCADSSHGTGKPHSDESRPYPVVRDPLTHETLRSCFGQRARTCAGSIEIPDHGPEESWCGQPYYEKGNEGRPKPSSVLARCAPPADQCSECSNDEQRTKRLKEVARVEWR